MMNQISIYLRKKFRIVTLSTILFKGNDIEESNRATSNNLFNFHHGTRLIPLEILIESVLTKEYIFTFITQHAKNGEHIIVYEPTKENIKAIIALLISCLHAETQELVMQQQKPIDTVVCKINDFELKLALISGVIFQHEGLNNDDREVVIRLFEVILIKLCELINYMHWEVSLLPPLVVLMDINLYDYHGPNYPITNILHTTCQVGQQTIDNVEKVLIYAR